jgi:hypothetical protein
MNRQRTAYTTAGALIAGFLLFVAGIGLQEGLMAMAGCILWAVSILASVWFTQRWKRESALRALEESERDAATRPMEGDPPL